MSTIQGKAGLLLETSRRVDANRNALAIIFAFSHGFNVLEIANSPGEQLRRGYRSQ